MEPSLPFGLHPAWYHLGVAVIILVLFIGLTRAVRWLLLVIGRKIVATTETDLDDRILDVVLANVRPSMLVIGLHVALRQAAKGLNDLDPAIPGIIDGLSGVLYVVGILILIKVGIGISRVVVTWYLEHVSGDGGSGLQKTVGPLASKTLNFLIIMVGLIVLLDHFGINIGSLLVSLGVGSLAVALAAQETLANMLAGFVILIDRPFRIGDRIEIAPSVVGDVLAIGLRSTRVLNFDNNVVIIPNADLVKARVTNYAFPYGQIRVIVRFDLAFGTDVARVRTLLLGVAVSHADLLAEPVPEVRLTGFSESGLQIGLFARATSYSVQSKAETELREQGYQLLQKEGIAMAIPRRIIITPEGKT